MERLDLYVPEYRKTGEVIERGSKIPKGRCVRVVFVCLFDREGKLLIQRRHETKSYGGMWDVSVGGAVISGEDGKDAARRETMEELGFDPGEEGLTHTLSLFYEQHIHDFYTAVIDIPEEKFILQPKEVSAVSYCTYEEICAMMKNGTFLPVYEEFLALLFRMKDKRGIML